MNPRQTRQSHNNTLMSPFYLPLGLAALSAGFTIAFLTYASRAGVSLSGFRRAWTLWILVVLGGGLAISVAGYQHMLSLNRSGDESCAFLLVAGFLGVLLPAYAGFGLFAWVAPSRWQRVIGLREESRAEQRTRYTRNS